MMLHAGRSGIDGRGLTMLGMMLAGREACGDENGVECCDSVMLYCALCDVYSVGVVHMAVLILEVKFILNGGGGAGGVAVVAIVVVVGGRRLKRLAWPCIPACELSPRCACFARPRPESVPAD